jgi:hypothetical protein
MLTYLMVAVVIAAVVGIACWVIGGAELDDTLRSGLGDIDEERRQANTEK